MNHIATLQAFFRPRRPLGGTRTRPAVGSLPSYQILRCEASSAAEPRRRVQGWTPLSSQGCSVVVPRMELLKPPRGGLGGDLLGVKRHRGLSAQMVFGAERFRALEGAGGASQQFRAVAATDEARKPGNGPSFPPFQLKTCPIPPFSPLSGFRSFSFLWSRVIRFRVVSAPCDRAISGNPLPGNRVFSGAGRVRSVAKGFARYQRAHNVDSKGRNQGLKGRAPLLIISIISARTLINKEFLAHQKSTKRVKS